jgi:hypothetical protein
MSTVVGSREVIRFAANIPTAAGASEYSTLAFCDPISCEKQRSFALATEAPGFDGSGVPDICSRVTTRQPSISRR